MDIEDKRGYILFLKNAITNFEKHIPLILNRAKAKKRFSRRLFTCTLVEEETYAKYRKHNKIIGKIIWECKKSKHELCFKTVDFQTLGTDS